MRRKSVLGLKISKWADKAKSFLDSASEIAEVINSIQGRPKFHNVGALSTIILSKVADHYAFNPHQDPTLKEPVTIPYEFKDFIRKVAKTFPSRMVGADDDEPVQISEIHGWTLVFGGSGYDTSIWYQVQDEDDAAEESKLTQALGRAIWEHTGSRVELAIPNTNSRYPASVLRPWSAGKILLSEQTETVLERTKKFIERNTRSLLLYGPPGTGKSCMIRAIADNISGTLLFLDSAHVEDMDSASLPFALDLLRPDIVLIDDLDRISDVKTLLSSIDRLRSRTKLLMVTVNHLEKMDAALVRAGRFDDIIEVRRVVWSKDIIPGLPEEVYEELDSWPVAFIEELRVRLEVLGRDQLEVEMASLRGRVSRNDKDDEPEETDE